MTTTGISLIFLPVLALAQLGGLGKTTGSVAGTATGAVNGTVSAAGNTVGSTPGIATNTTGTITGQEGASAGRTLGESANASAIVTQNAILSERAKPLLPAGTSLPQAATGFKDTSDFMTTAHLAHNMNIPFDDLKAQTTGKNHVSLEKAVARLRPETDSANAKSNLKLAEHQTIRDLNQAASPQTKDHVAAQVASNAGLSSRVQPLLPEGMSAQSAAAGFSSEREFLTTASAANSQHVSFADLKDRVTAGQSLGAAIHAMKPDMDSASVDAGVRASENQGKALQAGGSAQASASVDTRR